MEPEERTDGVRLLRVNVKEELIIRMTIEAMVVEFAWLVDRGQADRVVDLFTEDVLFEAGGVVTRGRNDLAARLKPRAERKDIVSRHVCSNLRLVLEGPGRIRGTVTVINFRHEGDGAAPSIPHVVGDWEDVYVLGADSRWRIAEHRFVRVFSQPK